MTSTFTLTARGPFSWEASAGFVGGFTPAAHVGSTGGHFHLAFCVEGSWQPAGVCLQGTENGLRAEVFGNAPVESVRRDVERIFSLDVDGTGWPELGKRDPVVRGLQERFDQMRPVLFWSSYESAVWAILSQRITMRQAAVIKARMAEEWGPAIPVHGEVLNAFPSPATLLEINEIPGVPAKKIPWLHGLARAALAGRLDSARLRAMDPELAISELRTLPGIGEMSSEHILVRGAGDPDRVTPMEPRLPRAIALAYNLDHVPDDAEVRRVAEGWRPYRTWVMVLLRMAFARDDPEGNARRR